MEFRNLTPFDTLCFSAVDTDDREHRVVAMKVGYRLLASDVPGLFTAQVLDEAPMPLCMEDTYYGEAGESSVREESDLAPFKPKCDVIMVGNAYAPGGIKAKRWPARIRISTAVAKEKGQSKTDTYQPLLDKTLNITGTREFRRDSFVPFKPWRLVEPEAVSAVPLRWEYAFGGASHVSNPPPQPDEAPEILLNQVCFSNPVGCGWIDQRHDRIVDEQGRRVLTLLRAPQIEPPEAPITALVMARNPEGDLDARAMAEVAASYPHAPVGFGVVGRAWAPRLVRAGTYDQAWLDQRWPNLPKDFDFGYWNGASEDQQIPHPPPDARIELWNLTDPMHTPDGYLRVDLPSHRAFVLLRLYNGALLPLPLLIDTLRIDTDAMTVAVTYRVGILDDAPIRVVEARFETDPKAPLLRLDAVEPVAKTRKEEDA